MSKQIVQFILFLVVFSMLGLFGYFYYVKPQREYIKINTQDCIKRAMASINNEVNKGEYGSHYSDEWFSVPLKKQQVALTTCTDSYNSILFSTPEKNLLELNLNSMIDTQALKIDIYKKAYLNIISENKVQQAKIDKCNKLKAQYESYQACQNEASKNFMLPNNCKYPQDAMSESFSCAMMGISF